MCLAQGLQRSDAGEAQTRGPSVSSQALYHWATALPRRIINLNIVLMLLVFCVYSSRFQNIMWVFLEPKSKKYKKKVNFTIYKNPNICVYGIKGTVVYHIE